MTLWLKRFGALLLLTLATLAGAQDVLPVPPLAGRVIDQTATLDAAQLQALSARLEALETRRGSQVVVLIVPSTAPEDIASYAQRVADSWKIGRREVGDGLLVVVAKTDRQLRIEVAKALEGAVPDLAARRVIDEYITPAFKRGDYAAGLNAGVDRLDALIAGEGLPAPQPSGAPRGSTGFDLQGLMVFLFIGVPIVSRLLTGMFGRKLGALATGGVVGGLGWWLTTSLLIGGVAGVLALLVGGMMGAGSGRGRGGAPIVWGGGGGGHGGWGGGGGGGGFGSGGGGNFGGGGASGRW